jgi:hypothetical protein
MQRHQAIIAGQNLVELFDLTLERSRLGWEATLIETETALINADTDNAATEPATCPGVDAAVFKPGTWE